MKQMHINMKYCGRFIIKLKAKISAKNKTCVQVSFETLTMSQKQINFYVFSPCIRPVLYIHFYEPYKSEFKKNCNKKS
jgi:hypothetical protein